MELYYKDIISRLGEPLWYDRAMCPRYDPFEPKEATIYGHKVALLQIRCQGCGKYLQVALDYNWTGHYRQNLIRGKKEKPEFVHPSQDDLGTMDYLGDPPGHLNPEGEYCHLGCTMTAEVSGILEFWELGKNKYQWQRLPEYEFMFI